MEEKMKKIPVFGLLLLLSVSGFLTALTAQDIVNKADKAFTANKIYSVSTVTVYRGGRARPAQEIEGYSMQKNGKSYSLSIYNTPERMKGTAMLMIDNDLWVRFASTGRVRKLSSSAKRNSAGGSDFSYADMGDSGQGLAAQYTPKLAGKQKTEGVLCYKVELSAKNADAPYSKIIVYIATDNYRYIQVDYVEHGAIIKTMTLSHYRRIDGLNYPFKIVMVSHVKDSKTVIVTDRFESNSSKIKDRYFTTGYLQSIR